MCHCLAKRKSGHRLDFTPMSGCRLLRHRVGIFIPLDMPGTFQNLSAMSFPLPLFVCYVSLSLFLPLSEQTQALYLAMTDSVKNSEKQCQEVLSYLSAGT